MADDLTERLHRLAAGVPITPVAVSDVRRRHGRYSRRRRVQRAGAVLILLLVVIGAAGALAIARSTDQTVKTAGNPGKDRATLCVRRGDAQVCFSRGRGVVTMSGQGLKPDSTIRIKAEGREPFLVGVDATGHPAGKLGFLGNTPSSARITAMTNAGDSLTGTVKLPQ